MRYFHLVSGVTRRHSWSLPAQHSTRTAVHYLKLPRKEGDITNWKVLKSNKSIIDIGLCIYSHNLIVNVATCVLTQLLSTCCPDFSAREPRINVDAPTTFDIELQLLEFLRGNPHPHAREHRIFVMNTEWEKQSVGIEILGDKLVLILSHMNGWRPDNRIFAYE